MTHYYDSTGPVNPLKIDVSIRGLQTKFYSSDGLFSKDHVDNASKLLIESFPHSTGKMLDLGCGWGVIGISLKILNPQLVVSLTDSNTRSVIISTKNVKLHKLPIQVHETNVCVGLDMYDFIVTNPPYSAGRKVCYSFIEQSYEHLNDKGEFYLVARHQKGGKMLRNKMEEIFGNVQDVAKGGGFRVYKSVRQ